MSTEDFKSQESKEAVLADLARERARVKELKQKLAEAQESPAEDSPPATPEPQQASLEAQARERKAREELAALKAATDRQRLRDQIAKEHGITNKQDIQLLLNGHDQETLQRQARRLSGKTGVPLPDPSQGTKEIAQPASPATIKLKDLQN